MIGRLMFELGNDSLWGAEIVAMLDGNKSSLLSGIGSQNKTDVGSLGGLGTVRMPALAFVCVSVCACVQKKRSAM